MLNADGIPVNWNDVIQILHERFPRELEIAVLAVRVAELEAANLPPPSDD